VIDYLNKKLVAPLLVSLSVVPTVYADTPLGWISAQNPSAYTLEKFEWDLSVSGFFVNDTIDVLNFRDKLIAADDNLAGDTGDISGKRIDVQVGLTSYLTGFASGSQHDLTIELGNIQSAVIDSVDNKLDTDSFNYGLRWRLFEGNLLNSDNRHSNLSIELNRFESSSADFDIVISEVQLQNLEVLFGNPQTFSVNNLEDDGWSAKLFYSSPISNSLVGTIWGGIGMAEATSGTTSDLQSQTIKAFFEQSFKIEEDYLYFGVGFNWQPRPRLPISVNYELINIRDSAFSSIPENPSSGLPGFLRNSTVTEDVNHTLNARISWWLTPRTNISLSGKLFSKQFLGVLPHYNNPLSGGFSDKPYGFIEGNFGFRF
jgi:hypothetical protein